MKRSWFGDRKQTRSDAERRLRYAVIGMLDATNGDRDWVDDVVELATYQWDIVNIRSDSE